MVIPRPWFVTGLPRSRTAWFAMVAGGLHEPRIMPSPWTGGVCDSGLGLYLPGILESVKPRTLIIERPMEEVMKSLHRYVQPVAMDWDTVREQLTLLSKALQFEHLLIKRVAFKDLDSLEAVRSCLDWLEIEEPRHLEQSLHMVVNSSLHYNLSLLAKAA